MNARLFTRRSLARAVALSAVSRHPARSFARSAGWSFVLRTLFTVIRKFFSGVKKGGTR